MSEVEDRRALLAETIRLRDRLVANDSTSQRLGIASKDIVRQEAELHVLCKRLGIVP